MSDREPESDEYRLPRAIDAGNMDEFNAALRDMKFRKQTLIYQAIQHVTGVYANSANKSTLKKMLLELMKKYENPNALTYFIEHVTMMNSFPAETIQMLNEAAMLVDLNKREGEKQGIRHIAKSLDPDATLHVAKMLGKSRKNRRRRRRTTRK